MTGLRQTLDGSILLLTLDRPRANAIDTALGAAFCGALHAAATDPAIHAVVLTGAGDRVFCAGADLKNPENLPAEILGPQRAGTLNAMLEAILDFPKPFVAAVNGAAAGAGAMLALLADRVLVADTARFSLPEIDVGMPTFLGLAILTDLAGSALAADLVQSARPMSAAEAAARGLATAVPADTLQTAALEAARQLAGKSQPAFAANKHWLQAPRREAIHRAVAASAAHRTIAASAAHRARGA